MKTPKDDSQRVDDTEENLEKCICKMCPTFMDNKLQTILPMHSSAGGKIKDSLTNKGSKVLLPGM